MIVALRCLLLFACTGFLTAQHTDKVLQLKSLGRDSLIRRAISEIKQSTPDFDPSQYHWTRVLMEKNHIRVVFANSFTVMVDRSAFKSSLSINLIDGSISASIVTNPPDFGTDFEDYPCFRWTKESRSALKFVLDAINRSDEVGDVPDGTLPPDTRMVIREETDHYDVAVDSWTTHSSYKVRKRSGKIYDASHKHYARDEDEMETELK